MRSELLALYPNPTSLCQAYTPDLQMALVAQQASKGNLALMDSVPSVGLVAATYGASTAVYWMSRQIASVLDFCEQKTAMDEHVMVEYATLLVGRYYFLNLLEFALFFAEVKLGVYGDFFGSVGPMQLSVMLARFMDLRSNDIDRAIKEEESRRREKWMEEYRQKKPLPNPPQRGRELNDQTTKQPNS